MTKEPDFRTVIGEAIGKQIIKDLFDPDVYQEDGKVGGFWWAFDQALSESFGSGSYTLSLRMADDASGLVLVMANHDYEIVHAEPLRTGLDPSPINAYVTEEHRAAAIADLEHAIEVIKKIPIGS